MRRFEFVDSTSNKFWEVEVKGETLNVTFGEIGTKNFATPEKAKAEMEKLIKEKTGKGYVEVGGKAVKPAAKKTKAGSMGEGLSKAEKTAKAEKVLAMFKGGQWELARGILESAHDEHWLFEELLKNCEIEGGKPKPSTFIKKAFSRKKSDEAELSMLEILFHLPKELEELQKLREELGIQIRANILSKYWKEVVEDRFSGVKYGDPENFTDQWYKERESDIAKAEQEGEVRSKALNMPWRAEKDLGQGVKLEMVLIPAGKFVMGSPKNEKGRQKDEKQHEVTLTKPFYMGKYQITVEQWKALGGSYDGSDDWNVSKFPKMYVSWNDCQEFINKLNAKTSGGYRLPTEAEWEYACRAGTSTAFSFGDEITPKDAKYADSGVFRPMAVGCYKPNAFGLYDMHGNAWEWCEDWYGVYPAGMVTDPKGPATGKHRVLRGGDFKAFGSNAHEWRGGVYVAVGSNARSSCRVGVYPSSSYDYYQGFRLARTI